jgi:hypothetical protein
LFAAFAMARWYATAGRENDLAGTPFPAACQWHAAMINPPGHYAAFGDGFPRRRAMLPHVAAVAAACRDPVLQWVYRAWCGQGSAPYELMWYDDSLPALSPDGRWPRSAVFPAHGGCFSSRSSWAEDTCASVVYGKVGREQAHEHRDVGQVCIDGHGERLIVDLGAPSSYPKDFFDRTARWRYYNASAWGHNVPWIADSEPGPVPGRFRRHVCHEDRGCVVDMDITPAYPDAVRVDRIVCHLLPGIVAVVDTVRLATPRTVSLRWHTVAPADLQDHGRFGVRAGTAGLAACVARIDGPLDVHTGTHEYRPPYDRTRLGDPLAQRREPFVEAVCTADACCIVSLFAVTAGDDGGSWRTDGPGAWRFIAGTQPVAEALLSGDRLVVRNRLGPAHGWGVPLSGDADPEML